jgi:outer membrane protein assembly factor BamB
MPDADLGRSSFVPAAAGPTGAVGELWRVTTTTDLSGPVLADGTVYVGGADGTLLALDARDGAERWRTSVGAAADTPWVLDGDVYVPAVGSVVTLDATDGSERWRTETPGRDAVLVASHGVYWISGRAAPTVVALARADGSERWRTDLRDPWEPHLFASDESLFVSSGTNGRIPWTLDPGTGEAVGDTPESGYDFPAERFHLDGTVYAVDSFFGNVAARPVDGGQGWTQGVDALGEFALSGGPEHVYYVANEGETPGLYALSRTDGTIEWTVEMDPGSVERPVVANECVLVRGDGRLRCFDPADGSERWSRPGDDVGTRFLVADDLLYTTRDDVVLAFRSS